MYANQDTRISQGNASAAVLVAPATSSHVSVPDERQKDPLTPLRPRTFAVCPSLGHPQNPAGDENHRTNGNRR